MTLSTLCEAAGVTRQAYYQERQRRAQELERDARVLSLVRMIRCRHPKLGTRKLLVRVRPQLQHEGLQVGRDHLFALLRSENLLVQRERQPRRTTWSGLLRLPNQIAGLTITRRDQVWVTDITYIPLQNGHFVYWFVVMDLFSRAILGETSCAPHTMTHENGALAGAGG